MVGEFEVLVLGLVCRGRIGKDGVFLNGVMG